MVHQRHHVRNRGAHVHIACARRYRTVHRRDGAGTYTPTHDLYCGAVDSLSSTHCNNSVLSRVNNLVNFRVCHSWKASIFSSRLVQPAAAVERFPSIELPHVTLLYSVLLHCRSNGHIRVSSTDEVQSKGILLTVTCVPLI